LRHPRLRLCRRSLRGCDVDDGAPVDAAHAVVHARPMTVVRPVAVCLVSAPEPIVCSVCVRVGRSSMLGGVSHWLTD